MVVPLKDSAQAVKSETSGRGKGVLSILISWSLKAKESEQVEREMARGNATKITWFPNSTEPELPLKCFNFKIHAFNILYS